MFQWNGLVPDLKRPISGSIADADDRKQNIRIKNRLKLIHRKMLVASFCKAAHHKQAGNEEKRRHMKAVNKDVGENSSRDRPPSAMNHALGGMAIDNQNIAIPFTMSTMFERVPLVIGSRVSGVGLCPFIHPASVVWFPLQYLFVSIFLLGQCIAPP